MVSEAAIRLPQTVDKDMIICHRALAWRPLKNETFFCQARKAKILTVGIHYVFRGLKFEA